MLPVQTMKVAAALQTVKERSQPGCLLTGLRPIQGYSTRKRLAGLGGAPVRELVGKSRVVNFLSADQEGGSGPAHPWAALTTTMLACKAESC